jgi:MFS family permease
MSVLRRLRRPGGSGMPREVLVLAVVAFLVAVGFGIIGPAIPLLAQHFGVSDALAATAISAFALFRFLSAIGAGRVTRSLGERPVLTGGLLLQAVTSIAAGLAPNFDLLIAMRAVGGIGSAAFTIASIAMVLRVSPEDKRGAAMSVYQGGFILGSIAGPAIGGLLTEISPRLPLIAYGICLVAGAAISQRMLQGGRPPAAVVGPVAGPESAAPVPPVADDAGGNGQRAPGQLARALRNPGYRAALLANLGAGWVFYGMRTALLPLYVSDRLGQPAAFTGLALLISAAAQAVCLRWAGTAADKWGRRPPMLLGTAVAAVSVAAFTLPINAGLFLLPMITFGVAGGLVSTIPAVLVGDVSTGRNERIIALFSMVSDLGAIVGPLVMGWLADTYSFGAAFWAATVILAAGFAASLRIPRATPAATGKLALAGEPVLVEQATLVEGVALAGEPTGASAATSCGDAGAGPA